MSKKKAKPTSSPAVASLPAKSQQAGAKAGRTKTSSEPWHLQNWFLLALGGLLLAVLAAFTLAAGAWIFGKLSPRFAEQM